MGEDALECILHVLVGGCLEGGSDGGDGACERVSKVGVQGGTARAVEGFARLRDMAAECPGGGEGVVGECQGFPGEDGEEGTCSWMLLSDDLGDNFSISW